jgi:hypothetical protein
VESQPKLTAPAATKCCRSCKTEKALDDFARHRSSKDGHRHDCKSCVANGRAKKRSTGKLGQSKTAKTVAKPAKYQPTAVEQAALDKYHEHRKRNPELLFKVSANDNGATVIGVDHPNQELSTIVLMEAIGTTSPSLFKGLVVQMAQLGTSKSSLEECELNFAVSIVKGIAPRDATEALLATQMAATHSAAMTAAWRLSKVENLHQQDAYSTMLNKCSRTFAAQMETLKKYRATGEQNIRVQHQHVTVNVTDTMQTGTGGYEKIEHQPHEPSASASTGPALLSNREENAQAMPSASGSGLDRVPMPRSTRRSANGRA